MQGRYLYANTLLKTRKWLLRACVRSVRLGNTKGLLKGMLLCKECVWKGRILRKKRKKILIQVNLYPDKKVSG